MDAEKLARQLQVAFVAELEDHVAALNRDLLALERSGSPAETAERVHSLFRTAHTIKGASRAASLPLVEALSHSVEGALADVRSGKRVLGDQLLALLFAAADAFADTVTRLHQSKALDGGPLSQSLARFQDDVLPLSTTGSMRVVEPEGSASVTGESVRVDAVRIDRLLVRTGELAMFERWMATRSEEIEAVLSLVATPPPASALEGRRRARRIEYALQKLAASQREDRRQVGAAVARVTVDARQLSMVPFREACQGLDRVARDVAHVGGKEVALRVESGDVEMDRAVAHRLRDPLLHLVRNAVDHGVEPPAERMSAGKPTQGTVKVRIDVVGSLARITVSDDGRGIDLVALRTEVLRRGSEAPADDRELVRMIVLPGMSTARIVTDVSGRGVGLDVVRQEVATMGGTLDFSFEKGAGTTFELVVPVSLTALRVLLVRVGSQTLAIPTSAVRRISRFAERAIRRVGAVDVVEIAGDQVRVASLSRLLSLPASEDAPETLRAVLVSDGARVAAILVDELLSEQELLLKSLGARAVSDSVVGGAILPSGQVVLILSPGEVVRRAFEGNASDVARRSQEETTQRTVLLVDDSMTTRGLERSILEAGGYRVIVAANGAEGFRLLQEQGADIIVSDVEMPEMDGFALTEAVRRSRRFRDLPVILVTALAGDEDRRRGLSAGANAYIVKSAFDQGALLDTLSRFL